MSRKMRIFYLALFLFLPVSAFAYLDPGTGSLLLYAVFGLFATALSAIRNAWYGLRGKLVLFSDVSVSMRMPDVIFHSEGGKYWPVFKPVVQALEMEGIACAYVTPDASDPGLAFKAGGFNAFRPGGEMATIAWMNAARAAMVVSTTPHLDIYMLKRSRGVRKYVHLFHAPTDLCFYEKYAFDWYDCLFTVGTFQERSVRYLETRRGTARKELLPTGCTYYDYMVEEFARQERQATSGTTVLYAPAWGVRSSALTRGAEIIDVLARDGNQVIFRPHPQFYISHKEIIGYLEKRFTGNPLVEIDRNRTGINSMLRSDLMITDLSGVLFDYALLFGKPILLANSEADTGGQEGEELPRPLWDIEASKALSFALIDGELSSLPEQVEAALAFSDKNEERIREFRDRTFYNFGKSGAAAAQNLASLLRGIS
ncbi:MAG: hypothetical protein A2Z96_03130 [Spirochaetes bacterium GWB1_48_6]|nr:MAG: hypothetical protein A2Z96_03130 [Spirochaetes bacterium GWB1_48_6]OHE63295.1 MAG: hypothetical protein A2Y36_11835 [Treponema sp. GWA1_62_8]OHE65706.1 MAG: hypothetical protein A2001_14920 [Treponema sp. GWC1_61_84]HCM25992.1 hypothetical protein [Treponema sp.]